jgi:hypothetical protein
MSLQPVSAYRCSGEDLVDLDKKTRYGIAPLLDSLNVSLSPLIGVVNSLPTDDVRTVGIAVDTTLASVFPLKFSSSVARPKVVLLTNCVPEDAAHSLATPFVAQAWQLTATGLILVPTITGILVNNKYSLTFWIR